MTACRLFLIKTIQKQQQEEKKQEHEKGQYVQGTRKKCLGPMQREQEKKDNYLMDCKYVSCLGKNKSIAKPRLLGLYYTQKSYNQKFNII